MQTCSLSHAAFPPALDPLPVLTDRFDSREEGPCVKSVWQGLLEQDQPTLQSSRHLSLRCVSHLQ